MRQGTTPTHTFRLPCSVTEVKAARVTYAQDDKKVLEKTLDNCAKSGSTLSVTLTQEETLSFKCNASAQVQVHILTTEGKSLVSNIHTFFVCECLTKEVLS